MFGFSKVTITDVVWDKRRGVLSERTYGIPPPSLLPSVKKLVEKEATFIEEQKEEMFLAWKDEETKIKVPSKYRELIERGTKRKKTMGSWQFKDLLDVAVSEARKSDMAFKPIATDMTENNIIATISPALCVMELASRRASMIAKERGIQTPALERYFRLSSESWLSIIADSQKRANE